MSNIISGRPHTVFALFGLVMGFSLSCIGFSNYDELHKMFSFVDLRLFFTFAGAVALAMAGFAILARGHTLPAKPFHKGTIAGSVLFGVGWAVSGACPGIALVQLGEGQVPALATVLGIASGVWLYRRIRARFLRWDTGGCES